MSLSPLSRPRFPQLRRRGFALVVTLSLMILLTVIAVGLLSLAGTSLRTTSRSEAMSSAQANARLSLMLALGELQHEAGSDTRVTARADILDPENPTILGVWKSWQGDDHEPAGTYGGRPKKPGDYRSEKRSRFLGWLTSSADPRALDSVPETTSSPGKVTLIGSGTVGGDHPKLEIHLTPTRINTGGLKGGLGWWIGGENQKARLPKPSPPDSATSAARWAAQTKSHAVADPAPLRMDSLLTDPEPAAKAITLGQADLIAKPGREKVSREFFHDLSAVSVGLLTNTATGGWRKDLSLLTEKWDDQPKSGLPMFRVNPGKDLLVSRATQDSPLATGSMLYPWATYRVGTGPVYQHGPVSSWTNLANYARLYKTISATSSGKFSASVYSSSIFGDSYSFLHRVRILPLIARIQWVFSHWAAPSAAGGGMLEPRVLVTPVVTLWNPYNVEINTPASLSLVVQAPIPAALRYTINGTKNNLYHSLMGGGPNYQPPLGASTMTYNITTSFLLKPGETRILSPVSTTPSASGEPLVLKTGVRSGGGNFYPVLGDSGKALALPGSTSIQADAKFDSQHIQLGTPGVGIFFDMFINGSQDLAYRMMFTPEMAAAIYKPLTHLAGDTLGHCQSAPSPFLSTIFGARMASGTHLAAKGFVQSSPFVNYTATGKKDEVEFSIKRHYGGSGHPVNSPFDYSFIAVAPMDNKLPNAEDATGRGYIVTGFNKDRGLSRCVIDELPTRPLVSLGELQNWDLRYENPVPPFAFNLIGNSDASPLLPSDAVVNSADKNLPTNLQYDDSYCANHVLFDDWFFSSIAPDPTTFGSSGRNLRTTYTDFITGKTPLSNKAYQPLREDLAAASSDDAGAGRLYTEQISKADSWKTVASRLEVEGMFNVNSTSVTAWRCLLGHARKQRVPYTNVSGSSWSTGLSSESDHAVTRFSISGDAEAGQSSSSGSFPAANDFAGYHTVDGKFLDALAEKVVAQVRQRGPFLSLSEFVNRQLSSGDLALAGTLQSALNEMTGSGSGDPLAVLRSESTPSVAVPEQPGQAEYQFPAAAVGYSTYGLPGWMRQADLLRPLAPILSARDDTFTIRAYGDACDSQGKLLASAVCEAVVRRTREFVDPADLPNITTEPAAGLNKTFGRRFRLVSFRWVTPGEI